MNVMVFLQLPDYHDVIEHPMDFGTVRKKLASNAYRFFEQFEVSVRCSLSLVKLRYTFFPSIQALLFF